MPFVLNIRSLISNFSVALLAQGIAFVVSCVISLLLPAFIDVAEFGYWQLFILFANYVGFFHLGLNDGVYLIEGGNPRSRIDKQAIKSLFGCGAVFQCVFAAVIVVFALVAPMEPKREFVLVATAAFLLLSNFTNYWGYVFQAMNETKLYSASVAINRLVFLVPLVACMLLGCRDFQIYVVFYLVAQAVALAFCLYKARDFLIERMMAWRDAAMQTASTIRVGAKLMIASVFGMLIIGSMQFFVDSQGDIEVFSKFSFALSMVAFFMIFIYQASMVLFPALRQTSTDEQKKVFVAARDCLDAILPVIFLLYFPAVALLSLWLPQYELSFGLFALLLPICIFDGKMDLIGTTYLKVIRKEGLLLRINLVSLLACLACIGLNAWLFDSLTALSILLACVVAGRSLFTEFLLENTLHTGHTPAGLETVALSAVFIASTMLAPTWLAIIIYALCYLAYLWLNRSRSIAAFRALKNTAK